MDKFSKCYKFFMLAILSLFMLTGCMTTNGNLASAPASYDQQMANDTANQLAVLYPPAQTRLDIKQSISNTDNYGKALIQYLRLKGYAINVGDQNNKPDSLTPGLNFQYLVDVVPDGSNYYRVTITIGQQTLSQVYRPAQNGKVYPAGSWVRKE